MAGQGDRAAGRPATACPAVRKYLREWNLIASASAEDHMNCYKPSFAAAFPPKPGLM